MNLQDLQAPWEKTVRIQATEEEGGQLDQPDLNLESTVRLSPNPPSTLYPASPSSPLPAKMPDLPSVHHLPHSTSTSIPPSSQSAPSLQPVVQTVAGTDVGDDVLQLEDTNGEEDEPMQDAEEASEKGMQSECDTEDLGLRQGVVQEQVHSGP